MNHVITFNSLENARLPSKPVFLAIGMFDGVHRGHQSVIDSASQTARAEGGLAGVLTFWPHPSKLFSPKKPTPQILAPQTKEGLLAERDIDFIITHPFSRDFASIPATGFLPYLKKYLPKLSSIFVGKNWHFGKGREGDVPLLVQEGRKHNIDIISLSRLHINGEPVSSTKIRQCLIDGDMQTANALLGTPYFAFGTIQSGQGMGEKIGFPTLNLSWLPPLHPRYGVYAVRVKSPGNSRTYPGVANYGLRPTIQEEKAPLLETHLLGDSCPFDEGDPIRVEWLHFLRPEQRFPGIDALRKQISHDKDQASRLFSSHPEFLTD